MLASKKWQFALLISLITLSVIWPTDGTDINLMIRQQPPSITHWFGTDWLGRDMFSRTLKALVASLKTGGFAVLISSLIAFALAVLGSYNKVWQQLVNGLIDIIISLPQLLLLVLLTLSLGGDETAVILAIGFSHWPHLARLLKTEIASVMSHHYVRHAKQFGQRRGTIIYRHTLSHLLPQWITGTLLLLPHIIIHLSALTLLGFGVMPSSPSMGTLLSEASRYLPTGQWWLAICPGIVLITTLLIMASLTQPSQKYTAEKEQYVEH